MPPGQILHYAFKISVNAASREREDQARQVIMAELQQMIDNKVRHAVHTFYVTALECKAVIRSAMLLKEKYMASGIFDKFKAILVAGETNTIRSCMTTDHLLLRPLHLCSPS
jgi:hypothetical protein